MCEQRTSDIQYIRTGIIQGEVTYHSHSCDRAF